MISYIYSNVKYSALKYAVFLSIFLLFMALISSFLYFCLTKQAPHRFIFMGGLHTEHPPDTDAGYAAALTHALTSLQDTGVSAVFTTSLGYNEWNYKETHGKEGVPSERAYLKHAFTLAHDLGVPATLHIRAHHARSNAGEAVSAEEILSKPALREDISSRIRDIVQLYTAHISETQCRIIVFDDDSHYYSQLEGGVFWLGASFTKVAQKDPTPPMDGRWPLVFAPYSYQHDLLFQKHVAGLYSAIAQIIRSTAPSCEIVLFINAHIGLRTVNGTSIIGRILGDIPKELHPDALMLRLYSKSYATQKEYEKKLGELVAKYRALPATVDLKLYLLAQLHTTNEQGLGGGRTPSLAQLHSTIATAQKIKIDGFGYYGADWHEHAPVQMETVTTDGKQIEACVYDHIDTGVHMVNDACSFVEDSEPLAPNKEAYRALFEPDPMYGTQRWDTGVQLLKDF